MELFLNVTQYPFPGVLSEPVIRLLRKLALRKLCDRAINVHAGLIALALMLVTQGCAVDLATLPDSSFNQNSASTRVDSRFGTADNTAEKNAQTAPSSQSAVAQVNSLTSSTNELLDTFGYSQTPISRSELQPRPSVEPVEQRSDVFSIEAVSTPVQALLFSLASDAGLQLTINGALDARVTLSSIDQPMDATLSLLATQAGFAWQKRGNTLVVWGGEAFSYSYPINYLNIHRRTQSSVGLATQVGTINATDTSGGSIANSSQTRVENISEHHFWDSLAADIKSILEQQPGESEAATSFSLNREAGLLTLYAKPDIHRGLQRYIKLLHSSTQRQVLIEATVVEVALSDNFDAGVDWQVLAKGISGVNAAQILVGAPLVAADTVNRITAPAGLISLVQQGNNSDVQATLSLLEQFGDVRILSRPRIIALNNQSSVLKVVDNRVYFTVNVQRRQTDEKDEVVTETEIHTVPVGLVMNVTPQISENNMVMLNVRPTLSRILGFVDDPNPELALANVRNGVPEIQVREMESMLQVASGNVAIIGGLMQETHSDSDARLPGLGAIPVLGRLFARQRREHRQTELLIVLRPTVLDKPDAEIDPRS